MDLDTFGYWSEDFSTEQKPFFGFNEYYEETIYEGMYRNTDV